MLPVSKKSIVHICLNRYESNVEIKRAISRYYLNLWTK